MQPQREVDRHHAERSTLVKRNVGVLRPSECRPWAFLIELLREADQKSIWLLAWRNARDDFAIVAVETTHGAAAMQPAKPGQGLVKRFEGSLFAGLPQSDLLVIPCSSRNGDESFFGHQFLSPKFCE
jgi:hypothetical protein